MGKHRTHLKVLTTFSRCFHAFVSLCFCVCLHAPAFSATEEIDMGMGLGIEPQAMVLITVPLNTAATSSHLQSIIDIVPNQTSHGFLIMQNNSSDDAAIQIAVVPENIEDNAPVFSINPTNFLISASSSRAIEYAVTSSSLTPIMCCKWNIYAAARSETYTAATIIEITGHMPGAESLIEETPSSEQRPSHILAAVFHDKDANGSISKDDTAMEGIVLRINDKTATTTTTGQAVLQYLIAGTCTISVDINTIPIEYAPAVPIEQTIVIPEDGVVLLNFPLQLSGRIEGWVFIDENRNGLFDAGEQGVRDAVIYAADNLDITSYDGRYRFSGMLSGRYTLKLNMESISNAGYQDYEPTTQDTLDIELQQGQRKNRVNFGIAKREKEIEFE
ncbi:MAG: SdrD B-like domain-containing protein [Candidatus Desantisbacteria bacterium]